MRVASRLTRILRLAALLAVLLPAPGRAADWIALEMADFRILSQVPERRARGIFGRLHIYMQALPLLTSLPMRPPGVSTTIFLLDYEDFDRVKKGHGDISGIFMPDRFRNYIVVDASSDRSASLEIIQHEYLHFAIRNAGFSGLPAFYEEGLADMMETFKLEGHRFNWGYFPAGYQTVARSKAMPLSQLFRIDPGSPEYVTEQIQTPFYARSLLLVHYCMIGNPAYRQPLLNLAGRIADGDAADAAFVEEFGVSPGEFDRELDTYLARKAEGRYLSQPKSDLDREPQMTPVALQPGEAEIEFAYLLMRAAPGDAGIVKEFQAWAGNPALRDAAAAGLAQAYEESAERAKSEDELDRLASMPAATAAALITAGKLLVYRTAEPDLSIAALTNTWRRAGSYFDAALARQPDSLEAAYWRGYVEIQMRDDLTGSARLLLNAYERAPQNADLALLLALHLDELGQEELALKMMQAASCRAFSDDLRQMAEDKAGPMRCFKTNTH